MDATRTTLCASARAPLPARGGLIYPVHFGNDLQEGPPVVVRPRFYLFDTGITNVLNRRLTGTLDPVTPGRQRFREWI